MQIFALFKLIAYCSKEKQLKVGIFIAAKLQTIHATCSIQQFRRQLQIFAAISFTKLILLPQRNIVQGYVQTFSH